MPLDKRLPYEFDIRIPMWIRGPGIDPGQSVTTPVLTIDLAPTLLDLAGVVQKYDDMDGLTLTPLLIKNNTVDHNNTSVNATEKLDKSYDPTLNSTVPIMYNYTGIQGRSNFLVEYHGEGSAHTSSIAVLVTSIMTWITCHSAVTSLVVSVRTQGTTHILVSGQ